MLHTKSPGECAHSGMVITYNVVKGKSGVKDSKKKKTASFKVICGFSD